MTPDLNPKGTGTPTHAILWMSRQCRDDHQTTGAPYRLFRRITFGPRGDPADRLTVWRADEENHVF